MQATDRVRAMMGWSAAIGSVVLAAALWAALLLDFPTRSLERPAWPLSGQERSDLDLEAGRELIQHYGCGACHIIPGVTGARGRVAPPLSGVGERLVIGGVLSNDEENLVRWIVDPRSVDPRTAMPVLGVSESEARKIARFLLFANSR